MPRGVEPTVLVCGRRNFEGLEQRLPRVFVLHAVEPLKRLVFGWDELPQIECPPLARQNPANSLMFLSFILLMQFWSPVSSVDSPQDRPFFSQEVSRMGVPDRNLGAAAQLASRGSVM